MLPTTSTNSSTHPKILPKPHCGAGSTPNRQAVQHAALSHDAKSILIVCSGAVYVAGDGCGSPRSLNGSATEVRNRVTALVVKQTSKTQWDKSYMLVWQKMMLSILTSHLLLRHFSIQHFSNVKTIPFFGVKAFEAQFGWCSLRSFFTGCSQGRAPVFELLGGRGVRYTHYSSCILYAAFFFE